jgi:hypothetical protein
MEIEEKFYRDIKLMSHERFQEEHITEMYDILEYIENKFKERVFDYLKSVRLEEIKDIVIGSKRHRHGGDYDNNKKSIIINVIYFGREADEENKKIATNEIGGLNKTFVYEIGQYLYDIEDRLYRFPTMKIIYINIINVINEHYDST